MHTRTVRTFAPTGDSMLLAGFLVRMKDEREHRLLISNARGVISKKGGRMGCYTALLAFVSKRLSRAF